MTNRRTLTIVLGVTLMVTLLGCSSAQALLSQGTNLLPAPLATTSPQATPLPPVEIPSSGVVEALQGTLETIYEQVGPSVVNIRVVEKSEVNTQLPPELQRFFMQQTPTEQYQTGYGSGFVWDTEGHIVTNNHVVEDADKISVTFSDGTTVLGEVVGRDPDSDLAVIKVDAPANLLRPLTLADSSQVKVGQLSIAIGNPFALEGTMTVGFVSAVGRSLSADSDSTSTSYTIPDIIQTDASINPGNSGGVLLNERGEVIGVTSAIVSSVNSSAGIGFAIPSDIVKNVVPTLIKNGKFEHPRLGITGTSLTLEMAQAMNLDEQQHGALVVEVTPNGPADKAGLRGSDRQITVDGQELLVGGDVITAMDGQPVKRFEDLVAYLARYKQVGDKTTLTILRDGKERTVELTLDARPTTTETVSQPEQRSQGGTAYLGVAGLALTSELAQAAGLPENTRGILLEQVQQGSPADEAGLRGSYKPVTLNGQRVLIGGDVITAVNGEPVSDMDQLRSLLQDSRPGDSWTLTILRAGNSLEVKVTLGTR